MTCFLRQPQPGASFRRSPVEMEMEARAAECPKSPPPLSQHGTPPNLGCAVLKRSGFRRAGSEAPAQADASMLGGAAWAPRGVAAMTTGATAASLPPTSLGTSVGLIAAAPGGGTTLHLAPGLASGEITCGTLGTPGAAFANPPGTMTPGFIGSLPGGSPAWPPPLQLPPLAP